MSKDPAFFDLISKRLLFVALLGVVIIILPVFGLSFDVTKKIFLSLVVITAFISWVIARWFDKTIEISKNKIFYVLLFLLVVSLVSGLISTAPMMSLVGLGSEQTTVLSLFIYSLLTFLTAYYLRSKKAIVGLALGLSILSLVVFAFQVIRLALPFLFRGTISFSEAAINLVGKWNELGIFFGFVILLSLILLRVVKIRSLPTRKIVTASIYCGLIGLVAINYWTAWLVLAIFSVALVIYLSIFSDRVSVDLPVETDGEEKKKTEKTKLNVTLVVLVVSVIFAVLGQPGGALSNKINDLNSKIGVNVLEVRPSVQGTWQIASQSLRVNPIFGAGPNRFAAEWVKYKPLEVNATEFWAIDFQTGVGYWPTFALILGGLGVISVLALLLVVFAQIVRAVLARSVSDPEAYALLFLVAVSTLYWWTFAVVYPLETVGLTMAFGSLGLLLAVMLLTGLDQSQKFELTGNPKIKFVGSVAFVAMFVVGVVGIYIVGRSGVGVFTAQRAAYAFSVTGDIAKADRVITQAISIDSNDVFLRQYALIKMGMMDRIASTETDNAEEASNQFQTVYGQARQALVLADQNNPDNYLNKLLLGRLLEKLVPLKVEGAYQAANDAYQEAIVLNPTNPGIYLDLARLEITNNSITKAREYIDKALAQKPNYIVAISLLSQIEADQGNLTRAIERAEQAVTLAPNDEGARFQLGFFLYQQGLYDRAVAALTEALRLDPNFANAKYFLGLSYQESGDRAKALTIFEELARLNPDNQQIKDILEDLQAPSNTKADEE